jgi:hypothetical protein
MPKASKHAASEVEDIRVLQSRSEELGSYTVEFTSFREDADATPLFKGVPDDRCQSPHSGYVLKGEEAYEAGDAYYGPPGHIPLVSAGTEIVEFSPTVEYQRTLEVVATNLAALQGS